MNASPNGSNRPITSREYKLMLNLAALEKQKGWVNLAATTKTTYAYQAF